MQPAVLPSSSANWALFFDFDGTLVDIAPTPDAVVLDPALRKALSFLAQRSAGALAIVSGRPIAELDHFLRPLTLPSAGVHGQEIRKADGSRSDNAANTELSPLRAAMQDLHARHPALLIEDKGYALALHTRARPDLAPACLAALSPLVDADPALTLLQGHCVFEVKAAGIDKGLAVRQFMSEMPFQGRRPLFVGDDRTDEDGILVAQELGGLGVKIGQGETQARLRLACPKPFRDWVLAQAAKRH